MSAVSKRLIQADAHRLDKNAFYVFRRMQGLTQKQMAELIGVSQPCIGLWEAGRRKPTWALSSKIAKVFGVTLDEINEFFKVK